MKQLLAAGYTRLFQICKCFRHKERGRLHLPELTMLEWYQAGGNYADLMVDCEELIGFIAGQTTGDNSLGYQGQLIHLETPWPRMSVDEAFRRYAIMEVDEALAKDCFDEVMVDKIEPNLGSPRPLFLYDYPASLGALARLNPQNKQLAERFELYIAGIELCNGFSELTDPAEQRTRFESEQNIRKSLNKSVYPMPQNFLNSLNDMPDACGNALGLDRLVMLFSDSAEIDGVVAFTPEEL
jgi:lysyl-tRNA synthetase class 2